MTQYRQIVGTFDLQRDDIDADDAILEFEA